MGLALLTAIGVLSVHVLRRPPVLVVEVARREDVWRILAVTGRIEAQRTVLVTSQFVGRLTEIVCDEGDRVRAGQVLARFEDTSAMSNVLEQRAILSSRRHDLAQEQRDLARVKRLVAANAVAAMELETAQLTVVRTANDVARLTAVLDNARARLVMVAPFDGTVVRRDGELGQIVGPTTTVFEIAAVDAPRVTAEVDERYVRALRVGMSAQILPVGSGAPSQTATISYIAQAVDPQTGAATVRFAYAVAPEAMLLGMSVDLNIRVAFAPGALTISREAVGNDAGSAFVLVVVDDRVERRAITIDDWPASSVVIRSGIGSGDVIVLDPAAGTVGARVRTKERGGA